MMSEIPSPVLGFESKVFSRRFSKAILKVWERFWVGLGRFSGSREGSRTTWDEDYFKFCVPETRIKVFEKKYWLSAKDIIPNRLQSNEKCNWDLKQFLNGNFD